MLTKGRSYRISAFGFWLRGFGLKGFRGFRGLGLNGTKAGFPDDWVEGLGLASRCRGARALSSRFRDFTRASGSWGLAVAQGTSNVVVLLSGRKSNRRITPKQWHTEVLSNSTVASKLKLGLLQRTFRSALSIYLSIHLFNYIYMYIYTYVYIYVFINCLFIFT